MEPRVAASALWLRALFAGTFAFFLGTAGHVMADGLLPGPALLTALLAVTVLTSLPFLARPATRLGLLVLLVGGQTVIHLCLTLTAGHVGDPVRTASRGAAPTGGATLPEVDGRRVGSFADAFAGTDAQPATTPTLPVGHLVADLQAHAPMMVAHLAAAALVALWLAHGERLLFTLLAVTAGLVLALVRPVLPVAVALPGTRPYAAARVGARLRQLLLERTTPRRGPPLLAS